MRRGPLLSLAVLGVVALTACGGSGTGADLSTLEGRSWVLEQGSIDDTDIEVGEDTASSLTIWRSDDQVRIGGEGCNSFSGTLLGWPEAVEVEEVVSTSMACLAVDPETGEGIEESDGPMAVENAVIGALPRITAISIDPAGITLTGDDVELVYLEVPLDQP